MPSQIQVDDIGTRLKVTIVDDDVAVDISAASLREITLKKPDDSIVTRTASVIGDGSSTSGVMYYDIVSGDLDQPGLYKIQGKVSIPSGTFNTAVGTFKVHCNL